MLLSRSLSPRLPTLSRARSSRSSPRASALSATMSTIKPGYALTYLKFTNPAISGYFEAVGPTLPDWGKLVAKAPLKDAAAAPYTECTDNFDLFVMCEFPSLDKAKGWFDSPEYQAILSSRTDNSTGPFVIAEGTGAEVEGGVGAFVPAFIKVTNPAFKEYPPLLQPTLDPYGGKIILRSIFGGPTATSPPPALLEGSTGEDYNIAVVLGFPSLEKAMAWKSGPEYSKIIKMRTDNSTGPLCATPAL